MTLKSHDLAHIRSVVLAGHAGAGKTTLAEQVLFRAGAIPRLGRVDDGTAHLDHEPEEQKQHRSLSLAVGTFERGEHEITRRRHARLPGLRGGDARGLPRRGRRADRHGRVGRRRGGPRVGGQGGPRDGHRGLLRPQQVRPREREPVGRARRAARRVRQQDRPAPPRDRRRGHVLGLRRPRPSQGVPLRERVRGRDPGPGRARRRGRAAPRPAARGGGRGRRRRVREVPVRGGDQRRGARRVPPQGRPRVGPRAGAGGLGDEGHRPQRAARRDRPLPPLARGGGPLRRDRQGGQGRRGRGGRRRSSSSACSRPPPTRSSAG